MKLLLTLVLALSNAAHAQSPVIWGPSGYSKNLPSLGFEYADGKRTLTLSADPTAGAGVSAPIGSLGLRDNSGAGQVWLKTGSADTAWTLNNAPTLPLSIANGGNGLSGAVTTLTTSGTINAMPIATSFIRYNNGSATTINGIANNGTAQTITLMSVGVGITLAHEAGAASASDRFSLPNSANRSYVAGTQVELIYDTVASRWKLRDSVPLILQVNGASTANIYTSLGGTPGGTTNLVLGTEAISAGTFSGSSSVLLGYRTGRNINGSPAGAIIIGSSSGQVLTGNNNTIIGQNSGNNISSGTANVVMGSGSATSATTASNLVAIGSGALTAATTGSNQLGIGNGAGVNFTSGTNNLALGTSSGSNTGGVSNCTAIGATARCTADNQFIMGSTSSPPNVGINNDAPAYRLDIGGDVNVTGNYRINGTALNLSNFWNITGNSGTTPGTNFLGTTDAQDLVFKTNASEVSRMTTDGLSGFRTASPAAVVDINEVSGTVDDVPGGGTSGTSLQTAGGYTFGDGSKDYDVYATKDISGTTVFSAVESTINYGEPSTGDYNPSGGVATDQDGGGYDPNIDPPPSYEVFSTYGGVLQSLGTATFSLAGWTDMLTNKDVNVSWTQPAAGPSDYYVVRNGTDFITTSSTSFLDTNSGWSAGNNPGLAGISNYYVDLSWTGVAGATGYRVLNTTTGTFFDTGTTSATDDNSWASGSTVTPTSADYTSLKVTGLTELDSGLSGPLRASSGVVSTGDTDLSSEVTGVLPLANGGTNKNATASNGALVYSDADSFELSGVGSAGQILRSGGAGAPTWSTATYPATAGSAGNVLVSDGTNFSANSLNLADSDAVGSSVLPIANGGTNKALTLSAGGVPYFDADSFEVLGAGVAGQFLTSGGSGAPTWEDGLSNPMDSAGDMIYGGASGVATKLDHGTAGQVLIANGAAAPVWTTLVPLTSGGTNKSLTAVNGGLLYTDADSVEVSSAGTAQQWALSGGAGSPTFSNTTTTGKVVDGSADEVQFRIQGNATQTNNVLEVEKSDGSDLLAVTNANGTRIAGTTTNDNASAGHVGEYVEIKQTTSQNATTSAQYTDCGGGGNGISLTAGDWDISFAVLTQLNGSTCTVTQAGIGTTSGNSAAGLTAGDNTLSSVCPNATTDNHIVIPSYRVSIASTTSYYGKILFTYSVGTPQYRCRLSARRVR